MPIPEFELKRVSNILSSYCEKKVQPHARDQLKMGYEISGVRVILYEERTTYFDNSQWIRHPIAKFRYTIKDNTWTLYWPDRHTKWHLYTRTKNPRRQFEPLLAEVDEDPTHIFYG